MEEQTKELNGPVIMLSLYH